MRQSTINVMVLGFFALALVLSMSRLASAENAKKPYPTMAPLDEYLMPDRDAEIALARSAAPTSVSKDATVMILGSAIVRNSS